MFIEDSTDVTVQGCSFNQTGGNALMLSNNVQDSAATPTIIAEAWAALV